MLLSTNTLNPQILKEAVPCECSYSSCQTFFAEINLVSPSGVYQLPIASASSSTLQSPLPRSSKSILPNAALTDVVNAESERLSMLGCSCNVVKMLLSARKVNSNKVYNRIRKNSSLWALGIEINQ